MKQNEELDAHPKAIQQIDLVGQLKKPNNENNNVNVESMFVLKFLEKIKEARLNFSRKCDSIIKDGNLSRTKS